MQRAVDHPTSPCAETLYDATQTIKNFGYPVPFVAPLLCGVLGGCGGGFQPLNKGLDPLAGGLNWRVASAIVGSVVLQAGLRDPHTKDYISGTAATSKALHHAARARMRHPDRLRSTLFTLTVQVKPSMFHSPFYADDHCKVAVVLFFMLAPLLGVDKMLGANPDPPIKAKPAAAKAKKNK